MSIDTDRRQTTIDETAYPIATAPLALAVPTQGAMAEPNGVESEWRQRRSVHRDFVATEGICDDRADPPSHLLCNSHVFALTLSALEKVRMKALEVGRT